jgi:hypothetical protein
MSKWRVIDTKRVNRKRRLDSTNEQRIPEGEVQSAPEGASTEGIGRSLGPLSNGEDQMNEASEDLSVAAPTGAQIDTSLDTAGLLEYPSVEDVPFELRRRVRNSVFPPSQDEVL